MQRQIVDKFEKKNRESKRVTFVYNDAHFNSVGWSLERKTYGATDTIYSITAISQST